MDTKNQFPIRPGDPISSSALQVAQMAGDKSRNVSVDGLDLLRNAGQLSLGVAQPPSLGQNFLVYLDGTRKSPVQNGGTMVPAFYNGKIYQQQVMFFNEFSSNEISLPQGIVCIAINSSEIGQSSQTITKPKYLLGRFIGFGSKGVPIVLVDYQPQSFLAKITAHSTTTAINFCPYTVQPLGSTTTLSAYNGFEQNGTTANLLSGSPGSLGVNIATDGTVNSGSCVVQPIGNGGVVFISWDQVNSRWVFSVPNSAQ